MRVACPGWSGKSVDRARRTSEMALLRSAGGAAAHAARNRDEASVSAQHELERQGVATEQDAEKTRHVWVNVSRIHEFPPKRSGTAIYRSTGSPACVRSNIPLLQLLAAALHGGEELPRFVSSVDRIWSA